MSEGTFSDVTAHLFFFCNEEDLMLSLSDENLNDMIDAFSSIPRYPDNSLYYG